MTSLTKYLIAIFLTALLVGGSIYYLVSKTRISNMPIAAITPTSATTTASPTTTSDCKSSDITASLGNGNGTAGTYYYTLSIKNSGASDCTYSGSTTISLLDSTGTALGSAKTTTVADLRIPAGQSIYSAVGFPDPGNFTGTNACKSGVIAMSVLLPNQITPVTVADFSQINSVFTTHACTGFSAQAFSLTKPS